MKRVICTDNITVISVNHQFDEGTILHILIFTTVKKSLWSYLIQSYVLLNTQASRMFKNVKKKFFLRI